MQSIFPGGRQESRQHTTIENKIATLEHTHNEGVKTLSFVPTDNF